MNSKPSSARAWLAALFSFALATTTSSAEIDISYEKFVLDNGLTLIVHEDHKAPVLAVNIWYHVGSKNEKEGKTGFAHLFEHLMLNGSENHNDDWWKTLDMVGATGVNGTTSFDRTNYFQVVPKNALDFTLWLESDRMGHLLGAIDQARLDEQRGVVQNEKRQGDNQPYGKVYSTAFKNIFPKGHPYSWPIIGDMEDLEAAALEDAHEWFNEYYGAANAVLVVAGDVEAAAVKERVEHYFGHIPPGPPLTRQEVWIPDLVGTHRQVMQDRVPQARLYKFWVMPEFGNVESDHLDLVAGILSEGKNSRLYKRLVHDDRIASNVGAFTVPLEIAGMFGVVATVMPGQELADVEAAIDEEVNRFLAEGPTRAELTRITTARKAAFVRGAERVGGYGGKSDILASNEVYLGDPGAYRESLKVWDSADASDLIAAANKWMNRGQYVLEVQPYAEYSVAESTADRSKLPEVGAPPAVRFDDIERATLASGLKVILAQRDAVPVVNLRLLVNAGSAADQLGLPGTASLAMSMLDEGTRRRTALEISDELAMLGATLGAGSNLDVSTVAMSALKENLADSLDLFADVILNPTFPEDDFERLRDLRLTAIKQEKAQPFGMALRVFPKLLYGEGHAYGLPLSGSGTEESIKSLETDALKRFHADWFKPNNSTLVVVGDVTMDEIKPLLERQFRGWQPGTVPTKNIADVMHKSESTIYLVDRPDSEQSIIIAGHIAPPKNNDNEIAIEAMNEVLGGSFAARINMNLREDKHWSYGANSVVVDAQGQRPMIVVAPVQTDKTSESMAEVYSELSRIRGENPPTAEEVARAKDKNTLTLAGRWETANAVAGSLAEMVRFQLPDNYWDEYPDMVRSLSDEQISAAAKAVLRPDNLVWVVVGDRARIAEKIEALGYGDVVLMDADGNILEAPGG
jgi:zinc protease